MTTVRPSPPNPAPAERTWAEAGSTHRRTPGAGYSLLVRSFKIVLPLVAITLLGTVFLFSRNLGGVSGMLDTVPGLGDGLRLIQPHFSGTTEKNEPYELRAKWALPDSPDPSEIKLDEVKGEINLLDGRRVELRSDRGVMYPKANRMTLHGDIVVTTSDGYRVETGAAELDSANRTLHAPGEIFGAGPAGTIKAGSMRATRAENGHPGGDVIFFSGGVRVVIKGKSDHDASAAEKDSNGEVVSGGTTGDKAADDKTAGDENAGGEAADGKVN